MELKHFVRRVVNRVILPHSQVTYAQAGEDLILGNIFYKMDIARPTYLDIGANDPAYISNSYHFYLRGSSGVCVEPNPYLFKKIKSVRPRDTVLDSGIGVEEGTEADFYLFPNDAHGLSTFSREEAEYWCRVGMKRVGPIKYEKVIKVPLMTVNTVIKKYFTRVPDFISLDVEGLDLQILQSLDYSACAPKVICVETLLYDEQQNETKNAQLIDFLRAKDYEVYADTHVNTIFRKLNTTMS